MVCEHSLDNPDLRGMGTTLTAAALVNEDGRDVIALVNVGDSRSYRFHDGELTQITVDHSLAEEMVRSGEISDAEAAVHPHRHILTRALGVADDVIVDLWRIQPVAGRPVPAVQRRTDQRARDRQIAEVLATVPGPPGGRRPAGPRGPHPRRAATTSRWWSSTWSSARTTRWTSRPWPPWPPTSRAPRSRSRHRRRRGRAAEEAVEVLPGPEPLEPEVPRPLAGPAQGPSRRPAVAG